jgi:hypothetical protein
MVLRLLGILGTYFIQLSNLIPRVVESHVWFSYALISATLSGGLKIMMPRLVTASGVVKPSALEAACPAAYSATAF